jgi:hypothetical protein
MGSEHKTEISESRFGTGLSSDHHTDAVNIDMRRVIGDHEGCKGRFSLREAVVRSRRRSGKRDCAERSRRVAGAGRQRLMFLNEGLRQREGVQGDVEGSQMRT